MKRRSNYASGGADCALPLFTHPPLAAIPKTVVLDLEPEPFHPIAYPERGQQTDMRPLVSDRIKRSGGAWRLKLEKAAFRRHIGKISDELHGRVNVLDHFTAEHGMVALWEEAGLECRRDRGTPWPRRFGNHIKTVYGISAILHATHGQTFAAPHIKKILAYILFYFPVNKPVKVCPQFLQ